jgi:hypothetical protein
MHINVTLFIQIGNFLLTYYALNRWLFKPIIASIQTKQKAKQKLLESISIEEEDLLAHQKKKLEQLNVFQKDAHEGIIPLLKAVPPTKALGFSHKEITSEEKRELKTKMAKLILEKVSSEY